MEFNDNFKNLQNDFNLTCDYNNRLIETNEQLKQ